MPTSGSGTMTPISGGVPGVWTDVIPFPYTLLSIYRYAQLMGIPPMHFASAQTPSLVPQVMPIASSCGNVWTKYDWQNADQVSHMQLAFTIKEAEYEIARALGYWPAPLWTSEEIQMYPKPWAREYSGIGVDISGRPKATRSNFGKVIAGGRRGVTLIGTATTLGASLVYSDDDSDGFYEHATITLPTTITEINEIKPYFAGHSGDLEWEIRPVRYKVLSGGNVIIKIDSWQLIDPTLYEYLPTDDGFSAIDISDVTNFVTSIEVYREYNNNASASSQFIWENDLSSTCTSCGGIGCEDCTPATQDGCLTIRNYELGIVTPFPAEYSNGSWLASTWTECREPDNIKLWYYSGLVSNEYIQHRSYDPLPHEFAMAIAWLASSRRDSPLCGCGNAQSIASSLQVDMALANRGESSYYLTPDALNSPFGTRVGEVKAWKLISKFANHRLGVAVI